MPVGVELHVLAVSAKHRMSLVSGFLAIETAFVLVHCAGVSVLIAAAYARRGRS